MGCAENEVMSTRHDQSPACVYRRVPDVSPHDPRPQTLNTGAGDVGGEEDPGAHGRRQRRKGPPTSPTIRKRHPTSPTVGAKKLMLPHPVCLIPPHAAFAIRGHTGEYYPSAPSGSHPSILKGAIRGVNARCIPSSSASLLLTHYSRHAGFAVKICQR